MKIKWPLKSILYVILGSIFGPCIAGAITLAIIRLAGFPMITVEGFNTYILTAVVCAIFVPITFMALHTTERQRLWAEDLDRRIEEEQERLDLYTFYRTLEEVDGIEYLIDN